MGQAGGQVYRAPTRPGLAGKERKQRLLFIVRLFCCRGQYTIGSLLHSAGALCPKSRKHHSSSQVRFHPHCVDQENVPQEGYLHQGLRDVHCDLEVSGSRAYPILNLRLLH